jgi:hypothetical protein
MDEKQKKGCYLCSYAFYGIADEPCITCIGCCNFNRHKTGEKRRIHPENTRADDGTD